MYRNWTSQEAEQVLSRLARHSPDIIWMFAPDWSELKFVDEAYEEIWGRPVSALAEDPTDFLDGIHPDDREKVRGKMEQLSDEEPIEVEYRVNAEEDYQRHVWVKGEPVYDRDGEFVGVAGFVRDVTERKRRKRELERKNARLENFTSIVSHDLRNPLNVAMGHLETVREECDSEQLDDIEGALERMETLIDELLTLARQGETIADVETVDLEGITERCWQTVDTTGGTLVVDAERDVRADPTRLQQLLGNLLRNAIEHGGEDVTVRVGDLPDGFYVEDDGRGFPEGNGDRVFEVGHSRGTGGTGLGLSIVEEIAEAHGWEIDAAESDEGGARFEVTGVDTRN